MTINSESALKILSLLDSVGEKSASINSAIENKLFNYEYYNVAVLDIKRDIQAIDGSMMLIKNEAKPLSFDIKNAIDKMVAARLEYKRKINVRDNMVIQKPDTIATLFDAVGRMHIVSVKNEVLSYPLHISENAIVIEEITNPSFYSVLEIIKRLDAVTDILPQLTQLNDSICGSIIQLIDGVVLPCIRTITENPTNPEIIELVSDLSNVAPTVIIEEKTKLQNTVGQLIYQCSYFHSMVMMIYGAMVALVSDFDTYGKAVDLYVEDQTNLFGVANEGITLL